MASRNDGPFDLAKQYHQEASDRLSEYAEELEITKDQMIAITEVVQSLMSKYDLSAIEISNLIFLVTSVIGWETDIQTLEEGDSLFNGSI